MKLKFIDGTHGPKPNNILVRGKAPPLVDKLDLEKLQRFRAVLDSYAPSLIMDELQKNPEDIRYVAMLLRDKDVRVLDNAGATLRKLVISEGPSSNALDILVDALKDNNPNARRYAAHALAGIARNGIDISVAIPIVTNALMDIDHCVRSRAAEILGHAAKKGTDISIAISVLANMFKDTDKVARANAMGALYRAVKTEDDIVVALPAIIIESLVGSGALRRNALLTLGHCGFPALSVVLSIENVRKKPNISLESIVKQGNYNQVKSVITALMALIRSKEFMAETDENSRIYIDTMERINRIMAAAHASEKKWANVEA